MDIYIKPWLINGYQYGYGIRNCVRSCYDYGYGMWLKNLVQL